MTNNSRWEIETNYIVSRFIVFSNWLYNTRNSSHSIYKLYQIVRFKLNWFACGFWKSFALTYCWLWLSVVEEFFFCFSLIHGCAWCYWLWWLHSTYNTRVCNLNEQANRKRGPIEKVVRLTAREFALNKFCTHQTNNREEIEKKERYEYRKKFSHTTPTDFVTLNTTNCRARFFSLLLLLYHLFVLMCMISTRLKSSHTRAFKIVCVPVLHALELIVFTWTRGFDSNSFLLVHSFYLSV